MSSTDLESFHNDLRAAVRAGVKLEIGDADSPGRSLSVHGIDQLEEKVANNSPLPDRFQAAID